MPPHPQLVVVGGGIVGLAIARELILRNPDAQVVLLEAGDDVGTEQTGHNSGVLHAGLYYAPGTLKARLCARGRAMLADYLVEHALPYDECGKLVVAVNSGELDRFQAIAERAARNGVPGLKRLSPNEIAEVEPEATGLAALHSPHTGITDFGAVARAYAADITARGGQVILGTRVTGLRHNAFGVSVTTTAGVFQGHRVVLATGLQADRVARLADSRDDLRIIPFRGEYLRVRTEKQDLVRGMIYPVPDPQYPFLGVHYTRRVDGSLDLGPNAVLALGRQAYRQRDADLADLREMLTWPGFWRMAGSHWRTGVRELAGSLSVARTMTYARQYVPAITTADVVAGGCGIRAQAVDRDGALVDDFRIGHEDGITTVRNAPSPAATSSLAIAEFVVDQILAAG